MTFDFINKSSNLTHLLFVLSRIVIFVCNCIIPIFLIENYFKIILLGLIGFLSINLSILYEKKINIFSPAYIFFIIIIFIVNSFCPFIYDTFPEMAYSDFVPTPVSYFYGRECVVVAVLLTLIFLINIKKKIIISNDFIFGSRSQFKTLILTFIILVLPLRFVGGFFETLHSSFFFYLFMYLLFNKCDNNITIKFFICMMISIFILCYWKRRYVFVELTLPILLGCCCCFKICLDKYKVKIISFILLMLISTSLLGLYGCISEMTKLNKGKLIGKYSIVNFIKDFVKTPEIFVLWFNRQLFRMFLIWTRLSGMIMDYVHENSYFFGISYFHQMVSKVSNINVNIPTIVAKINKCTYAQPGLFGEGYANFGYLGSYISLLIPFFLSEYLLCLWIKYRNMFCFTLSSMLLSKVLLDGGSINSMFNNILFVFITYSLIIFKRLKGNNWRWNFLSDNISSTRILKEYA